VDIEHLKNERRHTLDTYLRSELQNVSKMEKLVENGDPAHVIAEYARKEHMDLIMMPTHGHGPFRRLLLAPNLIRFSSCPQPVSMTFGSNILLRESLSRRLERLEASLMPPAARGLWAHGHCLPFAG
jgi:hypothetical protein